MSRRFSRTNRAPQIRLTEQGHAGRERPRRVRAGRQSQAGTGVVHAALSISPSGARTWRTAQGAVRSLRDRSRKVPHFSVLAAARTQGPAPTSASTEPLTSTPGGQPRSSDSSPLLALCRRQPGKENRNERELREGCRRATTLSPGWMERAEAGERRSGGPDRNALDAVHPGGLRGQSHGRPSGR
jgi:hypothetical protein